MKQMIDKQEVMRSFSRAALTYDTSAVLQREAGQRLFDRLELIKHQPTHILDLGSGTGLGSSWLASRYGTAQIVSLDLAHAMLMQVRARAGFWDRIRPNSPSRRIHTVCADMDAIPLPSASMDMIWSAFALQWSIDLDATLIEMARVMRAGGLLMFATFGPDTLMELRQAFSRLDDRPHVNHFMDMHDVGDALIHAGFETPVMDMEYFTLTYENIPALMRDLKNLGAHNAASERMRGLTGKSWLARLTQEYESFKQQGRFPATFEVVYGHAWAGPGLSSVQGKTIKIFPERRVS